MNFQVGDKVAAYFCDPKGGLRRVKGTVKEIRSSGELLVFWGKDSFNWLYLHPKACRKLRKKSGGYQLPEYAQKIIKDQLKKIADFQMELGKEKILKPEQKLPLSKKQVEEAMQKLEVKFNNAIGEYICGKDAFLRALGFE